MSCCFLQVSGGTKQFFGSLLAELCPDAVVLDGSASDSSHSTERNLLQGLVLAHGILSLLSPPPTILSKVGSATPDSTCDSRVKLHTNTH